MDIKKALQELAEQIYDIILERIDKYGANRNGVNTLKGSNLESSISVKVVSDTELAFEIADYYQAVVLGWHGFTGRYPHTWSNAIDNISKWAVRKGLVTGNTNANRVAYAIFKSIQKRGIQGRSFLGVDLQANERIGEPAVGDPSIVIPFLDNLMGHWADDVYKDILKELDDYFNN